MPIASHKPALSQLAVCNASSVATPKKSKKTAKLVPNFILVIMPPLLHTRASAFANAGHGINVYAEDDDLAPPGIRCQRFNRRQMREARQYAALE